VLTHKSDLFSECARAIDWHDFFRLENSKIVEHWDVLQPFPETSANDHPLF
jgi:predicted SnoaL-like aldol condensation-catalyzing enzyme